MLIFHIGLKEPPRSCTYLFASKGSKRSAGNWIHWFKEIQFYQVCVKKNKHLTLYQRTVKTALVSDINYGFHMFSISKTIDC